MQIHAAGLLCLYFQIGCRGGKALRARHHSIGSLPKPFKLEPTLGVCLPLIQGGE